MSKRNNSGYIGGDFRNDILGVIDREKQNQVRNNYYNDQYVSDVNLMGAPSFPDTTNFSFVVDSSGNGSGSTATAVLASGSVSSLVVYTVGSSYTIKIF